ncbi:MAG: PDZ domain-containing protein [Clostridia bacterium]|nr:PDZ domain-containing protein [Clostridia bacterium]
MSKKISLGVALSLVVAAIAATFAITMTFSQSIYNSLISNISGRAEMYSAIDDINALIRKNYYYFGSINNEEINYSISKGYINGLGDSFNRFMTASEYVEYAQKVEGKASGVGITANWSDVTGQLVVTSVASGSSANVKGIKENDIILKIAGETINASNYEERLKMLSGDALSTVSLTCKRGETELDFNVTIGYSYASVTHKMIGSIGYIRITAFYANTRDQLTDAVSSLQQSGATAIIFDLRNTSDGTVKYAAETVDSITPICSDKNEVLAKLVGRDGTIIDSFPSTSNNLNLPMAVLINEKTSGPAELFACDLKDFEKAFTVGIKTVGNGTAQQIFTLKDGSAVLLTSAKIIPYKSEPFEGEGLTPDYEVKQEVKAASPELLKETEDTQLQKAVSLLQAE